MAKKVLKFWAPWCGPCKQLSAKMKSISSPIPIEEVNVDEQPHIASEYQVMGIPTLIIVEGKQEIDRLSGNVSIEQLLNFLNK